MKKISPIKSFIRIALCISISGGTLLVSSPAFAATDDTNPSFEFTDEQQVIIDEFDKKYSNEWAEKERQSKADGDFSLFASSSSMGYKGDILVSYNSSSSAAFGGHAAIVVNSSTTIESFGNRGSLNGVRYWDNNWGNISDARGFRVKGASYSDKTDAVNYAKKQLYEPYNYNFFNVWNTDAWYCSQLVWRAWYEQGYDIDGASNALVLPGDLARSSNVTEF